MCFVPSLSFRWWDDQHEICFFFVSSIIARSLLSLPPPTDLLRHNGNDTFRHDHMSHQDKEKGHK